MPEAKTCILADRTLIDALLPHVVQAAADSASAATAAAASQTAMEQRLDAFQQAIDRNTTAIESLTAVRRQEADAARQHNEWLHKLATPSNVMWVLILLGGLIGVRMSIPVPIEMPPSAVASPVGP